MRRAALPLAFALLAASPAAGQIGINGTRQAATTGEGELALNTLSRCGRSSREANALAGRAARGAERELLTMTYRRYRYADGGLSEAEEAALARQEQYIDDAARSGYRRPYAESPGLRRYAAPIPAYSPATTSPAGDAGVVEPPHNPALPFRAAEPIRSYNLRHL
jgi:hypothetical protein